MHLTFHPKGYFVFILTAQWCAQYFLANLILTHWTLVVQLLNFFELCNAMNCSTPGFPVFHCFRICSNSCPLNWWCHPTISSSATFFSFCLWSFLASGSFLSQFFTSGDQTMGTSASASVLPMNIWGWFPLELTGLISLLSIIWRH